MTARKTRRRRFSQRQQDSEPDENESETLRSISRYYERWSGCIIFRGNRRRKLCIELYFILPDPVLETSGRPASYVLNSALFSLTQSSKLVDGLPVYSFTLFTPSSYFGNRSPCPLSGPLVPNTSIKCFAYGSGIPEPM